MIVLSSQPQTQLTNVDVTGDGEKRYSFPEEIETFYVKLTDMLNSSGLTLMLVSSREIFCLIRFTSLFWLRKNCMHASNSCLFFPFLLSFFLLRTSVAIAIA